MADSPVLHRENRVPLRAMIDLIATVAIIVASGFVIWRLSIGQPAPKTSPPAALPLPEDPVSFRDAPIEGDPSASVGVIQFSDFQCPYCGRFSRETLPILRKRFFETHKAFMAFRHYPIESLHPRALQGAILAICAADVGKFWKLHDEFFKDPKPTFDEDFLSRASVAAGLPASALADCRATTAEARVRQQIVEAEALKVRSTPTFFFGKRTEDGRLKVMRRYSGALPSDAFLKTLEDLQKKP